MPPSSPPKTSRPFSLESPTPRELEGIDPHGALSERALNYVSLHKPKVAAALSALRAGLRQLATMLQDADFAVVFEPTYAVDEQGQQSIVGYQRLAHAQALEAAITAYCQIDLKLDDPVNTPVRCHGAVGVYDARIIQQAEEVNRLKAVTKATFQPLTNLRVSATINTGSGRIVKKIPAALFILRQLQQSSLNRLGAYRAIPLIRTGKNPDSHPPTPVQIGFTAAWTGSVIKRTLSELTEEASADGRTDWAGRLNTLDIPSNEYLYHQKPRYLRMRANVWFPGPTAKDRLPKNYMGELPILFLMSKTLPSPILRGPSPRSLRNKPKRRITHPLEEESICVGTPFKRRKNVGDRVRQDR